ncbi:MAG: translation initiation factor [Kofleriaceae bacterium]
MTTPKPPGISKIKGLEALGALRDSLPDKQPTPSVAPAAAVPKGPARAVVRLERKGRRGKEATLVEKLGLPAAQLETWCRELKQALGCGGAVEGDAIALQGDLRQRLPALLETRGVHKITISG